MKFFVILSLIGVMAFSCLAWAESDSLYVAKGDEACAKFDNEKALEFYLKALEVDSTSFNGLWKASDVYVSIGDDAKKEEQKSYYEKAEKLARTAVKLYPDSAQSHFQLAVAIGKIALYEGGKTKINLSKELKEEADKTIELDPNHDGAYHIIARWNREISNLSWILKAAAKVVYGGVPKGASNENAVEYFQKAMEINPHKNIHPLELGKTYAGVDKWEDARSMFQKVLDLPLYESGDEGRKEEAKKLLDEIKDK